MKLKFPFHQPLTLLFIVVLSSCSRQKIITIEVNEMSEKKDVMTESKKLDIKFYEVSGTEVKYKNTAAISYAKKYSPLDDNKCGVYNNNPSANLSDCAHFIAHCLKDGGIEIKAETPNLSICKDGLSYRVKELTAALSVLSKNYNNVKQISINDAIVGDYGFFKIPIVRPTHAFMICQPAANTDDMTIYAHSTNRSCAKGEPKWYQFFDVAYRITDAN
jgi:hypothetical protein